MIKAPVRGHVKTRLAAEIGADRALFLYRRFTEFLVSQLTSPEFPWRPVIAYDPPDSAGSVQEWLAPLLPASALFLPQSSGDLGARLTAVFEQGFGAGVPSIIALGADCLEVTPSEIADAFEILQSAPLVMGPARDGGYWTIGMSAPHTDLFGGMPWSTPDLAACTRRRAQELDLKLQELPMKSDIDTRGDLDRLPPEIRRRLNENAAAIPGEGSGE